MGSDQPGIPVVRPIAYLRGRPVWPIMGGDGTDAPPADDPATAGGSAPEPQVFDTTLVPEAIRNSPEFRELASRNRQLAREAGSARAAENRARESLERERQAAEASQQAERDAQIRQMLGEDGVSAFNELAELSATDPVAAARRMSELMNQRPAQSAAGTQPADTTAAATTQEGEGNVGDQPAQSAQTPPSPPGSGVDGGRPLGAASSDDDATREIEGLTGVYSDVVKRNQDPTLRNRVTMRDRGAGMIAYLGASVLKEINKVRS